MLSLESIAVRTALSVGEISAIIRPRRGHVRTYFLQGLSEEFYTNLEKFLRYIYQKHAPHPTQYTLGEFLIEGRAKVEDFIIRDLYDPRFSTFETYIYGLTRDLLSTKARQCRRVFVHDPADVECSSTPEYAASKAFVDTHTWVDVDDFYETLQKNAHPRMSFGLYMYFISRCNAYYSVG